MPDAFPVDEILSTYAGWGEEVSEAVADALLVETRKNARTAFADKSKKLYRSIKKRRSKYDKEMRIVGAFAPHAHLVEEGHRLVLGKDGRVIGHVGPHPFLAPAVEAVRNRLPQIVENVVGEPIITVRK